MNIFLIAVGIVLSIIWLSIASIADRDYPEQLDRLVKPIPEGE